MPLFGGKPLHIQFALPKAPPGMSSNGWFQL